MNTEETQANETALSVNDPHPRYGPCDAMGFDEGACSECELLTLSPEVYKQKRAVHYWKQFKRNLGDRFLQHYLNLPYGSPEKKECRRMIDALSEIHQSTDETSV